MIHRASREFWDAYYQLPEFIQDLADKNFDFLEKNPRHPSLNFKKVGEYWSARVGQSYRAVAIEVDNGFLWFWIGTHAEYDRLIGR
jgi:hypothetical protein